MPGAELAIEVRDIRKTYGATVALDGVSFSVARGAVHALLGENGAGKSTAVKLLSGLVRPDFGEIRIFGDVRQIRTPREAHRLGIQTAFQEMTQIRDLTVVENMLLLHEPLSAFGRIRHREAERCVVEHLDQLGLSGIDPRRDMRDLDLPARQKVEIARAVMRRPRILLLDEPTSTLSGRDIDWLGQLIARLQAAGITIIFISHRMPEVRRFCDQLTVLRNGKDIGSSAVGAISDGEVIRMIIGRSIAATFPPRISTALPGAVPALVAHDIATEGRLAGASFALAPGEILGVAGLQGMGQLDLFLACFGVTPLSSGNIVVNGQPVILASPEDAVRANIGISLIPEDRKTEGLFLHLDGQQNVALPTVERRVRFGLIDRKAEAAAVAHAFNVVQVAQRALYMRVSAFSGGNQQKIAIAKWLLAESRILLMYDPTRGVDVGTKHEIYVLIREFAKAGGAVLFCSSEVPELVNLCDRVLVMYGGRIVRELAGDAIDEEAIMRPTLGEISEPQKSPQEMH